jgi:hypothetical protein
MTGRPIRPVPALAADPPSRRLRRRRGLTLAVLADLAAAASAGTTQAPPATRPGRDRD